MKTPTKKEFKLSKDSNIMEAIEHYPGAVEVFMKHGLPCVGCAAAHYEKISDISGEFGISDEKLVDEIRKTKQ